MKILWHSAAPWARTGYGCQTRLFAPRVRDLGHDVSISAYWGLNGAMMGWQGMRVYPGDEVYGNRLLPELVPHLAADLVITLMDVWVLDPEKLAGIPLACWVPVDHEPAPAKIIEFFELSGATPIAMSRFGQRMLTNAGLRPAYVPHGVDTSVYRPVDGARKRARERLGVPEDAFLAGMVAANKGNNPPRKAFPQVLQAFAQIRAEIPNSYLYMHTDPVGQRGVHLAKLTDQLGIPDGAVRCPSMLQLELGAGDQEMAEIYNAMDVLLNPSYGEGFGVPIIEAQACGTPVIVTACTAMSELCGAGWLVTGDPWFDTIQRSFYTCPSVTSIADALRDAHQAAGDPELRARAARFAADHYAADHVAETHWKPALRQLETRATRGQQVKAAA